MDGDGDGNGGGPRSGEEEQRQQESQQTEELCKQMFGKMGAYLTSEMTGERRRSE